MRHLSAKLSQHRNSPALLAVLEQGLFTAGNFFVGFIFLLQSGLEMYGQYAIVLSIVAVLNSIFSALVLEPLSVYGTDREGSRIKIAARQFAVLLVTLLIILLVPLQFDQVTVFFAAVVIFCAQAASNLARRFAYVDGNLGDAVKASAAYLMCVVALSSVTATFGELTISSIALVFAFASLVVWRLNRRFQVAERLPLVEALGVWRQTSGYARSSLLTNFVGVVALQSVYWVGASAGHIAMVGLLKFFEQVTAPGHQVVIALGQLRTVEFRRIIDLRDFAHLDRRLKQEIKRFGTIGTLGGLLFCGAVVAFYSIFRNEDSAPWLGVIFLYALIPALQSVSAVFNLVARSLRQPELVGYAYLVMLALLLPTSVASFFWGGEVLVAALFVGWAAFLFFLRLLVMQAFRKESKVLTSKR